ncbi:bacterial transcriptional activator domain-containing protein [Kitasatospora sp. NBC_00240]|uniref:bacterial transcriptional activator domain-containing protein n=1 Tax=Kitasatospora sp. NBC_00240 TaxID=2903567 RepID=UPI00225ADBC2|nr:bacterial transcriptional activator domain-containing protein [Kitasatospora sp. NBC_00240]MCX5215706.1 bacterial transcriptional activator domain-containing protein [Kitasatospora sp. NBC_00240]
MNPTPLTTTPPRSPELRTAIRDLIGSGEQLGPGTPPDRLARWRAAAFLLLRSICPPDDYAWQILRPDAQWPPLPDPEASERAFVEGWAITLGVLDSLNSRLPAPPAAPAPPAMPMPTLVKLAAVRIAHQPARYEPEFRKDRDPLEDLAADRPVIRLLGQVDLLGTAVACPDGAWRRRQLEAGAAWIHLHPLGDYRSLDLALQPNTRINNRTRDKALGLLREWVGAANFPEAEKENGYAFAPTVTSDWEVFQALHQAALEPGADSDALLQRSLELVQGPPCTLRDRRHESAPWVEPHARRMTEEILDVALHLYLLRLEREDLAGAAWAAGRVMLFAPAPERHQLGLALGRLAAGDRGAGREAHSTLLALRGSATTDYPEIICCLLVQPTSTATSETALSAETQGGAAESVVTRPEIRLLGPVEVVGANGTVERKRLRRLTEYASWLHLHPGSDYLTLDQALWPHQSTTATTRNVMTSRLRAWMGAQHFPEATKERGYAFADTVTSDWAKFQQHYEVGRLAPDTAEGQRALEQALELVRGRPFGEQADLYWWADRFVDAMTTSIVDAARLLVQSRLAAGDTTGALWAAGRGLLAAPESEHARLRSFTSSFADSAVAARIAGEDLETLHTGLRRPRSPWFKPTQSLEPPF